MKVVEFIVIYGYYGVVLDKKEYYQRRGVVQNYDHWRFRGSGGKLVNKLELEAIGSLLQTYLDSKSKAILDMPVGTGRLSVYLQEKGFTNLWGSDISKEMLSETKKKLGNHIKLSIQDAIATHFDSSYFDALLSLRFFFHHQNLEAILNEMIRIVKPGGIICFDTINWSPRTRFSWLQNKLGGKIWCHKKSQIRALETKMGFRVLKTVNILMFPSLVYRFLPNFMIPLIHCLENIFPAPLKTKTIWILKTNEKKDIKST